MFGRQDELRRKYGSEGAYLCRNPFTAFA